LPDFKHLRYKSEQPICIAQCLGCKAAVPHVEDRRFKESFAHRSAVVRNALMNVLKMWGIDPFSEIRITEIKSSPRA